MARSTVPRFSFLTILLMLVFALTLQLKIDAQSDEQAASRFSPVLHFTKDEKFYPMQIEYMVSNSIIKQRNPSGEASVIDASPTPSSLSRYTANNLFLDHQLGNFESIASDYSSKAKGLGYHAYVKITNVGSSKVIQYWLFYAYNNGPLNEHQGDFEVIQVFLDGAGSPQRVLLSQHSAGENAAWEDVEKVETHPVVYFAQGSHANYFRSYQGKIGIENDVVGADGITIMPNELKLIMLGDVGNRPTEQGWLNFAGRWGYWGTDQEVALGMAGPLGPAFNQNGIRWAQPQAYLNSTFAVDGNYFLLAWIVANFLLLFLAYSLIRGLIKIAGIARQARKTGWLIGRFLKSRGAIGLLIALMGVFATLGALTMPWYTVMASSETGPLARQGGVTLMSIDGANGVQLALFLGTNGDSTSGFKTFFTAQMPFAIFFVVGIALLVLDIIGVKNGRKIGRRFLSGAVSSLLPFVLIYIFVMQLPMLLPFASSLLAGQAIPSGVEELVRNIASNPISGSARQQFPIVGLTTVSWGFGSGTYLFVAAAFLRLIGGLIIMATPDLQKEPSET
ncbi:MAG: DUF946 domain-containing protein [Thaumarchaeota archaeon]|nr:DUF946 domain-containing protein [Nitrososphaerota archaeon]